MRTVLACICASLALLLCLAGTASAGKIYDLVIKNQCDPIVAPQEKAACLAYWGYRISQGQSRGDALTNCNGFCDKFYPVGSVPNGMCKNGCTSMNGNDI